MYESRNLIIDPRESAEATVTLRAQSLDDEYGEARVLLSFAPGEMRDGLDLAVAQEVIHVDHSEDLRTELAYAKESLSATIEAHEAANEQLQLTNEELVATNEELQSTNEELQSVNDQLEAANKDHAEKVEELLALKSDIENLLRVSHISVLVLDTDLQVRRFSDAAASIFSLVPHDVGRNILDLSSVLDYESFESDIRRVLTTLVPVERQVRGADRVFITNIFPYRGPDHGIRGVVCSFQDVTEREHLQASIGALEAKRDDAVVERLRALERRPLHVIIAEDSVTDARIYEAAFLRADPSLRLDHVLTLDALDAKLATKMPDLVLLDFDLPDADGIQAIRRVREVRGFRGPVVMLSGMMDSEQTDRAYAAGADLCLRKPERTAQLAAVIRFVRSSLSGALDAPLPGSGSDEPARAAEPPSGPARVPHDGPAREREGERVER